MSYRFWQPPVMPDDKDTILVLAGDLWVGTRWVEYQGYSWINKVANRFKQVVVVSGNHDHWPYGHTTIKNWKSKCDNKLYEHGIFNVQVLDSTVYEIEDVLFVGATLWTDMNKFDPLTMYNMSKFMHYDGKISFNAGPNGQWERFTSEKWIETHRKQRDYIKFVAENNKDKKIVVVTHHVPLVHLGDPNYVHDSSTAYYVSDLSDLILNNPQFKLWCFGHTHSQRDEVFGETKMYNNAVGYAGQHFEQQNLVAHEVIEI
jgi:predicted MPP superfamily phosphohydrolase